MALIVYGGGVAAMSGRVGGVVYSRNASGAYVRPWVMPINPGSARQQEVRFAVAQLSTRWVETLTAVQRESWATYAGNVAIPNRLGNLHHISGLAMYVRCNAPRLGFPEQAPALALVDDAPIIFDLGSFTSPSIDSIDAATNIMSLGFDNTDDWASEVGSAMFVFASRPKNLTVNYHRGPYGATDAVLGAVIPPTSPQDILLAYPVEVGQRIFVRANVSRADGRLSSSFRDYCNAT